jgi:hypothetical protein
MSIARPFVCRAAADQSWREALGSGSTWAAIFARRNRETLPSWAVCRFPSHARSVRGRRTNPTAKFALVCDLMVASQENKMFAVQG